MVSMNTKYNTSITSEPVEFQADEARYGLLDSEHYRAGETRGPNDIGEAADVAEIWTPIGRFYLGTWTASLLLI